jgi:hypothetical protein
MNSALNLFQTQCNNNIAEIDVFEVLYDVK